MSEPAGEGQLSFSCCRSKGWCLQAHQTHTWQLNSCQCPSVLPCLNLLSVFEILVSFPTWSNLAGRLYHAHCSGLRFSQVNRSKIRSNLCMCTGGLQEGKSSYFFTEIVSQTLTPGNKHLAPLSFGALASQCPGL